MNSEITLICEKWNNSIVQLLKIEKQNKKLHSKVTSYFKSISEEVPRLYNDPNGMQICGYSMEFFSEQKERIIASYFDKEELFPNELYSQAVEQLREATKIQNAAIKELKKDLKKLYKKYNISTIISDYSYWENKIVIKKFLNIDLKVKLESQLRHLVSLFKKESNHKTFENLSKFDLLNEIITETKDNYRFCPRWYLEILLFLLPNEFVITTENKEKIINFLLSFHKLSTLNKKNVYNMILKIGTKISGTLYLDTKQINLLTQDFSFPESSIKLLLTTDCLSEIKKVLGLKL